jgi:hypothetical protein
MELVELSRRVNDGQVGLAIRTLQKQLGALDGVPVLVLGLTYRHGVKELAYSRALPLIERLKGHGAVVSAHDPLLSDAEVAALGAVPYRWGAASDVRAIVTGPLTPVGPRSRAVRRRGGALRRAEQPVTDAAGADRGHGSACRGRRACRRLAESEGRRRGPAWLVLREGRQRRWGGDSAARTAGLAERTRHDRLVGALERTSVACTRRWQRSDPSYRPSSSRATPDDRRARRRCSSTHDDPIARRSLWASTSRPMPRTIRRA